ncbi:hypothetical protein V7D15_12640 [Thermoanaerobacter thermohydrosulfuricus]|uniref:Uncharacterized protein n=1 Tax=Thermoanaerobacter siderophilus SR4 TaxID=880478 RepID=I8QZL7_9THEO|nr:hypothetical protein [Thermoanaerobacter siderophilus]EIW00598.1 hypothetical protein ThesiDRAFT1_1692 [Thermoanaerobacter siderophilus SR4]HHY79480.1 hypothetical protein [Thermoanaerobacter sp.]
MTNINCTADCIYQKEGKCTLSDLSQMIKNNSFVDDNYNKDNLNSENMKINCAYYVPVKKIAAT